MNPAVRRNRFSAFFISLFLILSVITVFGQVRHHEFISFDDNEYVTENTHVTSGLTLPGLVWAFGAMHSNNWHPLTWLSHMLDCELYGLNPAGHHITNILFHIGNTLLLFLVLQRMTGARWKSGFVAALFALHPLHVESVAWVAERKDVLSAFFWMFTMGAYAYYARGPSVYQYLLPILLLALGLLSKPMLVTLPFVLLLLDYWPLNRYRLEGRKEDWARVAGFCCSRRLPLLWKEKLPFFALAAVAILLTLLAQQRGGTVKSLEYFPLETRVANALISYVQYAWKVVWPPPMAILYPFPDRFQTWEIVGAVLFLGGVTFGVLRAVRSHPYLAVGWLWYLGTLVPVVGLVQVGMQAMADRYTYLPSIGLFVMAVWGAADIVKGWKYQKVVFAVSSGITLLIYGGLTWNQVRWWQNSEILFEHTLQVTVGISSFRISSEMSYFRKAN